MDTTRISRKKFFWKSIYSGWTIMGVIVGVVGNLDTIIGYFVGTDINARPVWVNWLIENWPNWSWQWVVIGLIIILMFSMKKAYQMYSDEINNEKSLKLQFESDRLKLKQEFDQQVWKLWNSFELDIEKPIDFTITEQIGESTFMKTTWNMVEHKNLIPGIRKFISWNKAKIDGILVIKNDSDEPIRVRATGCIIDAAFELEHKDIFYIIQWQGIPDEDKIIWPNEKAVLYVVCYTVKSKNKLALPNHVYLFPTAEREKEQFKVNFIVEMVQSYPEFIFNRTIPPRDISIEISINASSIINPSKWVNKTMRYKIQPSGDFNDLIFERVEKTDLKEVK